MVDQQMACTVWSKATERYCKEAPTRLSPRKGAPIRDRIIWPMSAYGSTKGAYRDVCYLDKSDCLTIVQIDPSEAPLRLLLTSFGSLPAFVDG